MNKKAAIIIVNWNGLRFLKNCLTAVFNQSFQNFDVYFVDNGSVDESVKFVQEHFPQTKIVSLDTNTGFARGNNEGIDEAFKDQDVEYVVCLNNDTIVAVEWLAELIKTAEKETKIGAVTSKAYFSDNKTIQNAGLSFSKVLQENKKGGISIGYGLTDDHAPELSTEIEVFAAGGVAPLYRRDVLEKLYNRDGEIFDEDYFAYVEDLDLGFRIRGLGYKAVLSPKAILVHLHSQTGGKASPFKAYYCERNTILTAIKNLPLDDLFLFPFRNIALKLNYLFYKNESVEKLQGKIGFLQLFVVFIKANVSALFLIPKFVLKRRKVEGDDSVKRVFVKIVLPIFLTVITLYFLFRNIHFNEIKQSFIFSWEIAFSVLCLFFIIKVINTYRFSKVYATPFTAQLFWTLCLSNMMLSIFPFRLGEVSYILSLKKICAKNYSEIASNLLRIRLFDYLTIYLLLMASSLYVYKEFSSIIKIISAFFIISLIFFMVTLFVILKLKLSDKIKIEKFRTIFETIEVEIKNNIRFNPIFDLYIFLISLAYWSTRLAMGYIVFNLLGLQLTFFTIIFVSLAVFMLSLLPIQFFAGFGITEAGFVFFLIQFGFGYSESVILTLVYHIYILIPVVVYGAIGFLFISYPKNKPLLFHQNNLIKNL